MSVIATTEQLEAIYGVPGAASTVKVAERRVSSSPLCQCSRIEVAENSWSFESPS
jgi:hypothetical protein